jgi:hypothetical protein
VIDPVTPSLFMAILNIKSHHMLLKIQKISFLYMHKQMYTHNHNYLQYHISILNILPIILLKIQLSFPIFEWYQVIDINLYTSKIISQSLIPPFWIIFHYPNIISMRFSSYHISIDVKLNIIKIND